MIIKEILCVVRFCTPAINFVRMLIFTACISLLHGCTQSVEIISFLSEESSLVEQRNIATYIGYNGDEDTSYRISLLFENDTVYVYRSKIAYTSNHLHGSLVNLTGHSMLGDTLLVLNSYTYWFIPFSNEENVALSDGQWEFKCGCGGYLQPALGCEIRKTIGDPEVTFCHKPAEIECEYVCVGWQMKRPSSEGGLSIYPYGGIFVKAENLIEYHE